MRLNTWIHPRTGETRIYVGGISVSGLEKVWLEQLSDSDVAVPNARWTCRESELGGQHVLDVLLSEALASCGCDESTPWSALVQAVQAVQA